MCSNNVSSQGLLSDIEFMWFAEIFYQPLLIKSSDTEDYPILLMYQTCWSAAFRYLPLNLGYPTMQ